MHNILWCHQQRRYWTHHHHHHHHHHHSNKGQQTDWHPAVPTAYLQTFGQRAEQHQMDQPPHSPGHHERLCEEAAAERVSLDPCPITSSQRTCAMRRENKPQKERKGGKKRLILSKRRIHVAPHQLGGWHSTWIGTIWFPNPVFQQQSFADGEELN